jgi:hypothetical protein
MANQVKTSKPAKAGKAALKGNPLKAFKKSEASQLEALGTFQSFIAERFPAGTLWEPHRRSFVQKDKSCALKITTPDGEDFYLNCSKPVSQLLRNDEITPGQLLSLTVWQGKDWLNPKTGELNPSVYLGLNAQEETDTPKFDIRQMEAEEIDISSNWLPESFRTL